MDAFGYMYDERLWKPSPTNLDDNNFFHAAFGTKNSETDEYSDRFVHIKRKNWENCLSYLQNDTTDDIAKRSVTVEDIRILAALENIKIVILSELEPNSPNIITPNEAILQDYPYRNTTFNEEVVLFLQEGIFSRMEEQSSSTLDEYNVVSNQGEEDQKNNTGSEPNGYNKGGSAGLKGIQYQIALLVIFLLNAFRNLKKWKLSTENKNAGKFDDVVLEWPKGAILLQSKFKEDKKITLQDLISDNSKNDDFSLPKYFLFHQKVKAKFKVRHLIICTNASVHDNAKDYLTAQDMYPESMLHYESGTSKFYTFNEKMLPLLKQNSKSYYDKNCKNKGIEKSVITDKNLKDFLKRLQFYSNYPSQNSTEEIIENLLSRNKLQRKISTREIISKMTDWYQQKRGVYMSYIHAIAKFHEIYRDRYYQILEEYNVLFQNKDWDNKNPKQLFHIITETEYLLHELKIYRDLHDYKNKILYVGPKESIDVQKEVVDVFRQLPYKFLVIIWPNATEDTIINEICRQLKIILEEGREYKTIFLVTGENILSRQRELVIDDDAAITEYVTFEKLSNDTKERLLSQKSINFQGNKVNLNQLFAPKNVEDYQRAVNLETLQKLVKNKEIKVGIPLSSLDEHTNKCYIERMFKREIKMAKGGLNDTERAESFFQHIYDLEEKITLIKGSSGMGKTTELAKLALDLKEKYRHLWIIKIELKDIAGILKRHTAEKKTIEIKKLLNFKDTNHLEECVFSVDKKVIMLLDGIDEVSHYTPIITDLLIRCKNSPNFAKIFATTKLHVTLELEKNLKIKPFVLQPFTRPNQVDFLERYLTCNSKLDKKTCEDYIEMLSGASNNNNNINHFAAIPLQAKVAAEHVRKLIVSRHKGKCKRYSNEDTALKLPEISFIALFDALIEKKRGDYINNLNPNGIPEVNLALTEQFDKYLTCHEDIALEVILDETKCKLFSCYRRSGEDMQRLASQMGILQKSDDKFHFDCGTFAEYLFAKKLLVESKVNENKEFQRFFMEDILPDPKFKVVRGFLNSLLLSEATFNFKNCISLTSTLADQLEKENCHAILQFFSNKTS